MKGGCTKIYPYIIRKNYIKQFWASMFKIRFLCKSPPPIINPKKSPIMRGGGGFRYKCCVHILLKDSSEYTLVMHNIRKLS